MKKFTQHESLLFRRFDGAAKLSSRTFIYLFLRFKFKSLNRMLFLMIFCLYRNFFLQENIFSKID